MISLKLDQLAEKVGRNISEIAEETGINRNTITALFHNKVDGVKFATLEKICATYNIGLADILEYQVPKPPKEARNSLHFYRQEGEILPFTAWAVLETFRTHIFQKGEDEVRYGYSRMYFKDYYGYFYWDLAASHRIARYIYETYGQPEAYQAFYGSYLEVANRLEAIYFQASPTYLRGLTHDQLSAFFKNLVEVFAEFWQASLFVDTFDMGFDQEELGRLTNRYKLDLKDVATLSTPDELTYNNERQLTLLEIIKDLKIPVKQRRDESFLRQLATSYPPLLEYRKKFDYHKSNYAFVRHIEDDELVAELQKYLTNPALLKKEYEELRSYPAKQQAKKAAALKANHLKKNPLQFFANLTYWREHRKKVNLMGIHVLHMVMDSMEERTGIAKKYLMYLSNDEMEATLKGLVTGEQLARRFHEGICVTIANGEFQLSLGEEATSLREEAERQMEGQPTDQNIIPGIVACQGYARGIARIVMGQEDFSRFKEGEILITGCTRPEFVPLMKKAAAIVTNEGGITSHAAIVSRELGKPCIIGTKRATELIKDGDLVEVRAHHGTVRILK